MAKYPASLLQLVAFLRKLPGVGQKTAERFAFQMISWGEKDQKNFAKLLSELKEKLHNCKECGALYDTAHCGFCSNTNRDTNFLCIISNPKDIFTIENTGIYNGLYHVMPGLLSPLDNFGPEELHFDALKSRIESLGTKEVILALDSTVEGDATSLYLKKELEALHIFVSRLALGMPLGSSLEYIDEGTLSRALSSRSPI